MEGHTRRSFCAEITYSGREARYYPSAQLEQGTKR